MGMVVAQCLVSNAMNVQRVLGPRNQPAFAKFNAIEKEHSGIN